MLSSLRNIFKVPDLRNKILFTLVMIAVYRFGAHIPVPGVDLTAVKTLQRAGEGRRRARLPQPVLRRGAHAVRRLRARDHAVHHRVDHHADPRCGDPEARGVAEPGRGRPAQDHAVDALPRHRASPLLQATGLTFLFGRRWRPVVLRSQRAEHRAPARLHAAAGAPRGAHAHRRHRPADVDGRAHHPAWHRQRHVDPDLLVGRQPPAVPATAPMLQPRAATSSSAS